MYKTGRSAVVVDAMHAIRHWSFKKNETFGDSADRYRSSCWKMCLLAQRSYTSAVNENWNQQNSNTGMDNPGKQRCLRSVSSTMWLRTAAETYLPIHQMDKALAHCPSSIRGWIVAILQIYLSWNASVRKVRTVTRLHQTSSTKHANLSLLCTLTNLTPLKTAILQNLEPINSWITGQPCWNYFHQQKMHTFYIYSVQLLQLL